LPEDCGQRTHPLREVFNGLRYVVKTGAPWRWLFRGLAEARALAPCRRQECEAERGHLDSRTLPSTPESGARAGYTRRGRESPRHPSRRRLAER
jgi:transposase